MSPPRALIVAAVLRAGCAAKHQAPPLAVPELEGEKVALRAVAARPIGPVQPVAVAVTNGLAENVRVDARQAYATNGSGERIAPVPPGEAARLGQGHALPARSGAPSTSLAPGLSATGYVYYPEGEYESLELLLSDEPSGRTLPERAPIASAE